MAAPPYQKLFWGSYHKHTAHLSHAREHGAYLLLIGALWNNDGRLPADDATLAGYAKLTAKEWDAIKPKLMPLFRVVRGKLTQPRVTEDLAKYESTSGKRKLAGKTGGKASAEKRSENRQAIASDLPTKPEPESKKETPVVPRGDGDPKPEGITVRKADVDAVWEITPRIGRERSSRKDVERALVAAARRGKAPDRVRAGLVGYYTSEQATKDGGQFAKGCHRMIENDRWEEFSPDDDPPPLLAIAVLPSAELTWARRLAEYGKNQFWNRLDWGPPPGRPGCQAPADLLEALGFTANRSVA